MQLRGALAAKILGRPRRLEYIILPIPPDEEEDLGRSSPNLWKLSGLFEQRS